MHTEVPTKLPLSRFAALLGIHPLHFWGVSLPDSAPRRVHCDAVWPQHEWQAADQTSRDELAHAIAEAERLIEGHVGYHLLPSWDEDEWRGPNRSWARESIRYGHRDIRGMHPSAIARYGHILSGGIRSFDVLDGAAAITYSDPDADGYDELATVSAAAVGLVHEDEIHLYHPGHAGDPKWEIRPVTASFAAGVVTVTCRRELLVLADVDEALEWRGVDGDDDANFESELAIVRVYNDPQAQVTFVWEPTGLCDCGSDTCGSCAYSQQTGCFVMRDPEMGILAYSPATWNAETLVFDPAEWRHGRSPDLMRLFYYSGWRDKTLAQPTIEMDHAWAVTVARFAISMLERPVCACAGQNGATRWQEDVAFMSGSTELAAYRISRGDLDNPFGTRRGAVYAWRRVREPDVAQARGVVLA